MLSLLIKFLEDLVFNCDHSWTASMTLSQEKTPFWRIHKLNYRKLSEEYLNLRSWTILGKTTMKIRTRKFDGSGRLSRRSLPHTAEPCSNTSLVSNERATDKFKVLKASDDNFRRLTVLGNKERTVPDKDADTPEHILFIPDFDSSEALEKNLLHVIYNYDPDQSNLIHDFELLTLPKKSSKVSA